MSVQAGDANSMPTRLRYVARTKSGSLSTGREVTLVSLKKRKFVEGSEVVLQQSFFNPDPLDRVLRVTSGKPSPAKYPRNTQLENWLDPQTDMLRCAALVLAWTTSSVWKLFMHGPLIQIAPPNGCHFTKKTPNLQEVEITALLHCVGVSKGLPPFTVQLYGFLTVPPEVAVNLDANMPLAPLTDNSAIHYAMYTEKSNGLTLHAHLNEKFKNGDSLQLEEIITQVSIAIRSFQKYAGLVHNDLHLDNILVERRLDGDSMVVLCERQRFSFAAQGIFVRIIDFGEAAVVHPIREALVTSRFTANLTHDVLGNDIARLFICIVKWAIDKQNRDREGLKRSWTSILGEQVMQDVFHVLSNLTGDVVTAEIITEYLQSPNETLQFYPFDVGADVDLLLRHGSCARMFRVDDMDLFVTSYRGSSIFQEREKDIFCSARAIARFRSQFERPQPNRIKFSRQGVARAEVAIKYVFGIVKSNLAHKGILHSDDELYDDNFLLRLPGRSKKPALLHVQQTSVFYRRRVGWRLLVLFEQAVLLFLKLFFDIEQSDTVHKMANQMRERLDKLRLGEDGEFLHDISARHDKLLLASLLFSMTGDHEPFFKREQMASMFEIAGNKAEANQRCFHYMRRQATHVRDRIGFQGVSDGESLLVDAHRLSHGEVYQGAAVAGAPGFPTHLFELATNPLLYGGV
jgi:serine/threonine protein kinase